jgi:hypothetical protein
MVSKIYRDGKESPESMELPGLPCQCVIERDRCVKALEERLKSENPTWSARRASARAIIEYAKGTRL